MQGRSDSRIIYFVVQFMLPGARLSCAAPWRRFPFPLALARVAAWLPSASFGTLLPQPPPSPCRRRQVFMLNVRLMHNLFHLLSLGDLCWYLALSVLSARHRNTLGRAKGLRTLIARGKQVTVKAQLSQGKDSTPGEGAKSVPQCLGSL